MGLPRNINLACWNITVVKANGILLTGELGGEDFATVYAGGDGFQTMRHTCFWALISTKIIPRGFAHKPSVQEKICFSQNDSITCI